ncbi:hypothetical protein JHZ66_25190, partial [Pseudomonas cannabina pv. alisalensis]|nr:hypothetical protein [Pseudomonas cannabina pv. alisalensis]
GEGHLFHLGSTLHFSGLAYFSRFGSLFQSFLKDQYDKKAFIWINDFDWTKPIGSWADLTYALLEKLVKDGLAPDSLRCKLFARDLGL